GGVGAYTFWYAEGGSYLSDDPRACVNCHVMRDAYDGWQHGGHHHVATCNDCHTPHDFLGKWWTKAENGFNHSPAFTFQDFPEPIRIGPRNLSRLERNCVACHRDTVRAIIGHGAEDEQGCVRCHRSVGHGPTR